MRINSHQFKLLFSKDVERGEEPHQYWSNDQKYSVELHKSSIFFKTEGTKRFTGRRNGDLSLSLIYSI